MKTTILAVLIGFFLPSIKGHGRLIEPPSRASAWRYGFNTPHNYNDHELYCGGFTRQWVTNEGKCGVCGDAWDTKLPRPHEFGGTYGEGVIVRKYHQGSVINVRVELTANHNGFFEFAICPDYKTTTQECLDQNVLRLARPQENVEHQNVRYYPKEGNKVYEMKYKLPEKTCEHCVLQWRYIAGNNWGNCPNGTGAVGCGPQEEFRACADITIVGKGEKLPILPDYTSSSTSTRTPITTPTTTSSPGLLPEPGEESYTPITAIFITFFSFLAVFLILFLLYFHYYQVGKQVKNWIKGGTNKRAGANATEPPLPPPRARRTTKNNRPEEEGAMYEINLKSESLA